MIVVLGVAVSLLASSCGSRVPHEEIVAAAGNGGAAQGQVPGSTSGSSMSGVVEGQGGAGNATVSGGQGATGGGASGLPNASAVAPGVTRGPDGAPVRSHDDSSTATGPGGQGGANGGRGGGSAPQQIANGAPVTLANIGGYSGVLGALHKEGRTAAQVWAQSVNARGGLNGHPVRMLTADEGSSAAKAVPVIRNLVENEHALACVGCIMVLSYSAVEQYARSKNIPIVSGEMLYDLWWKSPVMFPVGAPWPATMRIAIKPAVDAGNKKVGIVYCGEAAACKVASDYLTKGGYLTDKGGAIPRLGAQLAGTPRMASLVQPSFSAECAQLKSQGANLVFIALDVNSARRMTRDCKGQGYHPQYSIMALAAVDSAAEDPNMDGVWAAGQLFPWMLDDTPAAKEYQAALDQYSPGVQRTAATAAVWAGGKTMELAAKALTANPTTADLFKGLWSIRNSDIFGLAPPGVTFRQGGPTTVSDCAFLMRVQHHRWVAPLGSKPQCGG